MSTDAAKQKMYPLPDIGDILFILVLYIPLFARPNFVFGDGSTGWHLETGEYILNNHVIPHTDIMSYTYPGKAWVAYEWLSDVFMAMVVRLGGLNLLAVLVCSAIAFLFLLLYDRCRKEGAHFLVSLTLLLPAIFISAIHWLARPHLFTFYGVYFFVTRLEDYYRGTISSARMLLTLALYMVLWVNTHPAFIIGYVLIVIYLGCAVVEALYHTAKERADYLKKSLNLIYALLATLGASMINPYGPQLYVYIAEYLKGSKVLAATDEFLSPVFHGNLQPVCLEMLFAWLLIGLAISKNKLSMPRLVCCVLFCHLTLSAVRNMPLFAIVVVPAIAHLWAAIDLGSAEPASWWKLVVKGWNRVSNMIDDVEFQCKMHLAPLLIVVVLSIAAINKGSLFGTQLVNSGWDPKDKPTRTLDYLVAHEKTNELSPTRGFNFDNWGGYIKYQIKTPVFMDDRADFYGEKHYTKYSIVSQMMPGWKDVLNEFNVQWILFPKNSRVVATLKDDPEWSLACEDDAAGLLVRKEKTDKPKQNP